jgi:vitamin B12 transporter
MKPNFRCSILAATIAATLSYSALAAEPVRQPAVTVTATRYALNVDEALTDVTVISRAEIEASQAPDLIDLLARQTGVDVTRTGGPGSSSALFLRGTNSNHTLVLIDGIRVNSASQGVFDFAHLPLEQIERIELVRGPRAALWGSDAIGGVLHIITRNPHGKTLRLRGGSYGRADGSAALGTQGARGAFGVVAAHSRVRGFSATNPDNFSFDPDDDGYRNRNISLRGTTPLGSQTLGFSAIATDADVEFDRGETFTRNASGGLALSGALGVAWDHALSVGHAREDLTTPAFGNAIESRRRSADWVHTVRRESGVLNVGVNWQRESAVSMSTFSGRIYGRTRTNRAGFAGYASRFGSHEFEAALRHHGDSQFGGSTVGNAGWGWRFADAARLRATWGEGFRAPNFNELYHPGFGGGFFAGNPDLNPEQSRSLEAGIDWTPASGHELRISAYHTRIGDLIAFAGPRSRAVNIARAKIDGAEIEHRWQSGAWSWRGGLTWQDPVNADTGAPLLRRANRKGDFSIGYRFGTAVEMALDAHFVGERADIGGDLSAYSTADLRLGWPVSPSWRVEARLENVFDRDYVLVRGYNTPGRSWLLTLAWTPMP